MRKLKKPKIRKPKPTRAMTDAFSVSAKGFSDRSVTDSKTARSRGMLRPDLKNLRK